MNCVHVHFVVLVRLRKMCRIKKKTRGGKPHHFGPIKAVVVVPHSPVCASSIVAMAITTGPDSALYCSRGTGLSRQSLLHVY